MHKGRRAFLRGLGGAVVSLPLLEFTHGKAWAGGGVTKRFLTVFEHGGTISNLYYGYPVRESGCFRADGTDFGHGLDYWAPVSTGETLVELGPIHSELDPWKSKLLVVQGVDNTAAIQQRPWGGHGSANVTALTAADITEASDNALALGPSIDHVLAARLAALQPVRFARIHLSVEGHDYGTPYFRAAREPVRGEADPRVAFDTIFEGVTASGGPDPAFVRRRLRRGSVLDGVLDQYTRFRGRVSASDLIAIDAHLEHLRALEREVAALEMPPMCMPPVDVDPEAAEAFRLERVNRGNIIGPLHVKIIIAALRCGLTNIANLEISDLITPWVGGTDWGYEIGHSLHHYAREIGPTGPDHDKYDQWFSEMLANRRWRMSLVRQLLEGLDDPAFLEAGRTLLDNSLVLCTSEFSNGSVHLAYNQPVLLAGSAGGYFRTGRNIDYDTTPGTLLYDSRESTHNLFTSILQAFGGTDDHFGSDHAAHRGQLPGLT